MENVVLCLGMKSVWAPAVMVPLVSVSPLKNAPTWEDSIWEHAPQVTQTSGLGRIVSFKKYIYMPN